MSSTLTATQAKNHQKGQKGKQKPTIKRTSSLAQIRRLNTFICSQQLYIFSAILAWLKSSQQPEKTIGTFNKLRSKLAPMKIAVYSIALILTAQLTFCLLFLTQTSTPGGLLFLVCCWIYINYLHYRTTFFYVAKTSMKKTN